MFVGEQYCENALSAQVLAVANCMHAAMVELTERTDVVLQAARACGWLSWRPSASGKLVRADTQAWAKVHPEKGGRVSDWHLSFRYNWLDEAGRPQLAGCTAEEGENPLPGWLENDFKELAVPDEESLCLELKPHGLAGTEEEALAAELQLHPRDRADTSLAEALAKLTPQGKTGRTAKAARAGKPLSKRAAKAAAKAAKSRAETAKVWQADLAKSGQVVDRLTDLIPSAGTGKRKRGGLACLARKADRKNKKKRGGSGKLTKRLWLKSRRHGAAWKAAQAAKLLRSELVGKTVRLLAAGAPLPDKLRNCSAAVVSCSEAGFVCRAPDGTCHTVELAGLGRLHGSEREPFPEKLPALSGLTAAMKALVNEAAAGQLAVLKTGSCLESPEMAACWHEVGFRCLAAGHPWPLPGVAVPAAVTLAFLIHGWKTEPGSPETRAGVRLLTAELAPLIAGDAGFVGLPLVASGHWTCLLAVRRKSGDKLQLCYKDSLPLPSAASAEWARTALSLLLHVLGPEQFESTELPACSPCPKQADGWSCGYFVLAWLEEALREHLGEGPWSACRRSWTGKVAELNRFLAACRPKAPAKAAPPPAAAAPAPAASASAPPALSESLVKVEPADVPPAAAPICASDVWGCSRCRWSVYGCTRCNPDKVAAKAAGLKYPVSRGGRSAKK